MVVTGRETVDKFVGTAKRDSLKGNRENNILEGLDGHDLLFGGDGDDVLKGGDGKDILRGQKGGDLMDGGGNNDVLYALGTRRNMGQTIQDRIFELTGGLVFRSRIDSPDVMIGSDGNDLFYIYSNKPHNELGFYRGQQYAVIKDFTAGEDKIHLPGGHNNYVSVLYGKDNRDTAIIYVEHQNDFSNVKPDPGIRDKSLQFQKETALVAIVENADVRNMVNSDFYTYEKVSISNTSDGYNPIVVIIISAIAICSMITLKLKKNE